MRVDGIVNVPLLLFLTPPYNSMALYDGEIISKHEGYSYTVI
jgi:hypothetical protein